MCRFSIPFVVSHASHLFWIWNKQIQHCPWLQQCMCASTSVCVCGMQTILLVFQFICWARRVLSSMCGEILFCMCAICVDTTIRSDLTSVYMLYAFDCIAIYIALDPFCSKNHSQQIPKPTDKRQMRIHTARLCLCLCLSLTVCECVCAFASWA